MTEDKTLPEVAIKQLSQHITQITGARAGYTDCMARIVIEDKYATVSLTENGNHWSGSMLNPENVDNLIAILEVYKKDFLNKEIML